MAPSRAPIARASGIVGCSVGKQKPMRQQSLFVHLARNKHWRPPRPRGPPYKPKKQQSLRVFFKQ